MRSAAPTGSLASWRSGGELPAPVSGQRHDISGSAGRLAYFCAGPDADGGFPALLLIHSINAAASAYEIRPLYEQYRQTRKVYALELPGFGHSDRSKRPYTVRMMTDAILAMVRKIQDAEGPAPIDALAVSLSSEFLTRAAVEMPRAFRTVALISPTGFRTGDAEPKTRDGTRAMPWLHALLDFPPWSRGFFRLLTSRPIIRYFLRKTWGSPNIDEGLAAYDYITTHQPGAEHAPYYFVSGYLFSQDILQLSFSLAMPVWMVHGTRGDFVDYTNKGLVEDRPNWTIQVFETGAMPYFEVEAAFVRAYDAFLAGATEASPA